MLTLLSTTAAATSHGSRLHAPAPHAHAHAHRALQRASQLTALAHQGGRSVGANKRVRHHVNPLRSNHQNPLELADAWTREYYQIPTNPLHVDIGCARGVFCLDAAQALRDEWNVLGLEIREPHVDAARADVERLGLRNAAFFATNANVNLERILAAAAPVSPVRCVSVQFPDPWFKARHHKRRVVQPPLVRTIADWLEPGGHLLLQTDVAEVAREMRDVVLEHEPVRLRDCNPDADGWEVAKPPHLDGLSTERERSSEELNRPIYRSLFVRTAEKAAGGGT